MRKWFLIIIFGLFLLYQIHTCDKIEVSVNLSQHSTCIDNLSSFVDTNMSDNKENAYLIVFHDNINETLIFRKNNVFVDYDIKIRFSFILCKILFILQKKM